MSYDDDKEDEEISVDFSKIKSFFKKKTEKDSVKSVEKEAEVVKENINEKIEETKQEEKTLEESKEKVEKIEQDLKKEDLIVDAKKEKIEKNLEEDKKELEEVKESIDGEDEEISFDFGKVKGFFKGKAKEDSDESKEESEDGDKEDEELNIDFSKIKNIFKSKKTEEDKSEKKEESEGEDEEISFDFGKVKSFFKGFKEKESKEKGEDDEVSLDVRKTVDFVKKYKSYVLPAALIFIAIFFCVYLRVQPAYLPATDNWATSSVHNQIRSSISSQINQQYPNLPEANKNSLVETEFQKVLKEQKAQIDQQITGTSNYFKSRLQDERGQTYLLAIDPYFWMRHAKNVLENGHSGDEIRNGRSYDTYMYAPTGRNIPIDMFHAYFEAYLYKFVSFFNRDLSLMALVFYVPILLSALCVFPAFLIGRRLAGNFGGFIAAFVIAVHPSFLTRTAGGFADTDAYNVLFPLLITWLFLEAFETKNIKKIVIYSTLSGLFVGLFSFAWGGWFYIFDFILLSSVLYLAYFIILHRNEIHNIGTFIKESGLYNTFISILVFIVSSALFTSMLTNFERFTNAFIIGPLAFATLKQVAITTIWPNVYTTVAEQNPASLDSAISQIGVGSSLLFLIGLTGIALTMLKKDTRKVSDLWFVIGSVLWFIVILGIRPQNLTVFLSLISIPIIIKLLLILKDKEKGVDIKAAILLILWYVATIYASVKGVRYILLAVPAFAIALGVALGIGYKYLHRLVTHGLKINKNVSKVIVVILLCLLLLGPYRSAQGTSRNEIPSMNDAWYSSLKKIDLEGAPDAIINSWWDFGHWFKAIGNRGVTFDGTSQNSQNAHWIGSVLATDDELYAIGTLRMVDCGQYRAFNELDKTIKDGARTINLIEEIVRVDKEEARAILLKRELSEDVVDKLLENTHCDPPENYFITSYDMVGKSGVWAHFGSWNFDRALIYNTLNKKEYLEDSEKGISFLQDRFNYSRDTAESIYYDVQSITSDAEANSWIAPWPSYAGYGGCRIMEEDKINCDVGQGAQVEIDLETLQADIQTAQGIMHPNSVVIIMKDGEYRKREFNDTIGVSLVIEPTGDESYRTLISSPELDMGMFTRMFYFNGHGLRYFDKFSDVTDITGGRIIVWKVNWEGNSTNLLPYYQPKPVPVEDEIEEEITEEEEGIVLEEEAVEEESSEEITGEVINESVEEELIEEKSDDIDGEEGPSVDDSQDINMADNSSE